MFRVTIENLATGEKVIYELADLDAEMQFAFDEGEDLSHLSETERAIRGMPDDVRSSAYLPAVMAEFEGRMLSPHTIQAIVGQVRYNERRDRSRGRR